MNKQELKFAEDNCICRNCPSYAGCSEKPAYCGFGKSKCIKEKKGCICGGCPVHQKLGLKSGYYCVFGKEK
jgi:hypothetical protein